MCHLVPRTTALTIDDDDIASSISISISPPPASAIMFAQRSAQQSLRRIAASQPSISQAVFQKFGAPAAAAMQRQMQTRPVATQKLTPNDSYQILVAQRKNRPTSPHLTIYKPQITWLLSSLNRITGVALSGGFYLFGTAYLAAPLLGWHLDSATMAAAFGSMPEALKVATKFIIALPFTFHGINGVRHLTWDLGKQFTNAQVIRTGWTVVGLTVASTLYLATMV